MRNKLRSLAAVAAVGGVAVVGAVVGAQPANAAANANSCFDLISRGAVHKPAVVLMTTKATLPATTAPAASSLCAGMTVSIGISRDNGHDFRNRNATRTHWKGNEYYYRTSFPLTVDDYGRWIIRQIAVKDRHGNLSVRRFTNANTTYRAWVKYESTLTGKPTGALPPATTRITGHLKAWHYYGRQVNVQKQPVVVQVRRPGTTVYTTVATAVTSRTGTYGTSVNLRAHRGKHVRVAYISRIPIYASDYSYLGRVR